MQEFQQMTLSSLVDMLAQKTERYTQLLAEKAYGEEFEECRNVIQVLQSEIISRNQSNASHPDIQFGEPDTTI
jgi:hypothetical protein